jgi:hypothetical protein
MAVTALIMLLATVEPALASGFDIDFESPDYVAGEQPSGPWYGVATVQAGVGYEGSQGLVLSGDGVYYELPTPLTSEMGAVSISVLFYPEENGDFYGSNGGVMIGWESGGYGAVRDVIFQKVNGSAGIYGPGQYWGTFMGSFVPYHWYQITFDIQTDWESIVLTAGRFDQQPVSMTTDWNPNDPVTKIWLFENQQSGRDAVYDNFGYNLPVLSTVSGVVLDTVTALPLQGVEVTYWSERHELWRNDITDAGGFFSLTGLEAGLAEIQVRPDVAGGYAWNLPWMINSVNLEEGEQRTDQIITLKKGALVSGYVKDSTGQPIADIEVEWAGKMCAGQTITDSSGYYEMRLPPGYYKITTYKITIDGEEEILGGVGASVTVTDVSQPINVDDIVVYYEMTGSTISGSVVNSGSYPKTDFFTIAAFEAGTVIGPDSMYTLFPVSETGLEQAGNYTVAALPSDCNYDVYLLVFSESDDDIESCSVRDGQLNISPGATAVDLYYTSEGGTITGTVENVDGNPVIGAYVVITKFAGGQFAGFTNTDGNGNYIIHNVEAGQYVVTASHSMYQNTSTAMVEVVDAAPLDVNTISMPFVGDKEAGNLNGDGIINMFDFAALAENWMQSGSYEADFDQSGMVEIGDIPRISETWLYRPIWYNK